MSKRGERRSALHALLPPRYGMRTSSLAAVEMRSGGRARNLSLDGLGWAQMLRCDSGMLRCDSGVGGKVEARLV
jgi:hypothetical protein